ncbi:MAG: glycosyltransferase family 4 protein [Thermoleophilaceae bacterium]
MSFSRALLLKVLMVGPDPAARGGIASVVRGYLEEGFPPTIRVAFVVTHTEGGARRRLGRYARALGEIAGVLRHGEADIVHIHLSMGGSLVRKVIVMALARRAGVPVVLHVHGSHFDDHVASLPRPLATVARRQLASAAAVIALSGEWRRRLEHLAPRARVVAVPNGVAVPPPPVPAADGPFVTFGRVERRKGSFDLVKAMTLLDDLEIKLVMAGDGAVGELRELAAAHELGARVSVREWVDPHERDRLLRSALGFVLPSYAEGLPVALLEAMAQGLPVVATPVGGIPELIEHDRSGLLVTPGDVEGLAAALKRIANEPELRGRLGAEARRVVEAGFTRRAAMDRLTTLWLDVAGR